MVGVAGASGSLSICWETHGAGASSTAAAIMASPQFPLDTDPVLVQRVADLMQEFGLLGQRYDVKAMIP